jgi:hypothetical protein
VDALEVGEAAERIRASHIQVELAAALEQRAGVRPCKAQTGDSANWPRPLEVARAADPDPW